MVAGVGHGSRLFGSEPFSHQPPEFWCLLPMAELPAPELLMPVSVTCHPKIFSFQISGSPLLPPLSQLA
jgi:hypothetical protein